MPTETPAVLPAPIAQLQSEAAEFEKNVSELAIKERLDTNPAAKAEAEEKAAADRKNAEDAAAAAAAKQAEIDAATKPQNDALAAENAALKAQLAEQAEMLKRLDARFKDQDVAAAKTAKETADAAEAKRVADLQLTEEEKKNWGADVGTIEKIARGAINTAVTPLLKQISDLTAEVSKLGGSVQQTAQNSAENAALQFNDQVFKALPELTAAASDQKRYSAVLSQAVVDGGIATLGDKMVAAVRTKDVEAAVAVGREVLARMGVKLAVEPAKNSNVVPIVRGGATEVAPAPAGFITDQEFNRVQQSYFGGNVTRAEWDAFEKKYDQQIIAAAKSTKAA